MEENGNGQVFPFRPPKSSRTRRWKWVRWLVAIGLVLVVVGLVVGKVAWAGIACIAGAGVIESCVLGDLRLKFPPPWGRGRAGGPPRAPTRAGSTRNRVLPAWQNLILLLMNRANSGELIKQIMGLNAPVMGTGESGGGFFGMTGYRQQALLDLKRITASFAAETQKAKPDQAKIADLTSQIEASLRTLFTLNIISEPKLTEILQLLHE